ncbi:putative Zn(II)2Cys6 transcription factor [Aspergillus campestris IBT 28561]|uniref:Zn(II)2Cys6 transcription factor n=1 Tax=Aspergillus campestris (strain IBT 28561) TaxID=1392248 RepID=A0A2I1D1G7_ASPC2|nr:putative Zn(II)2Cys6 transcription factor [Aspergillus campestris IBT 28561]PKY03721.1 putative Zn(II)2Cys6 transcription factor [Aspergillus campestris IBT 28561]
MSSLGACDECFRRKRKCHPAPNTMQCIRCQTSSLSCTRTRRPGRIGRPPNTGTPREVHSAELVQSNHSREIQQQLSLPDLDDSTFYEALDIWMFGSSFARDFHRAIHYCHQNSPWLLHEMFITMDTFLEWARFSRTTSERVDIKGGARSLQKLRTVEVTSAQDALAVLMLGQALAAFDLFVTFAGSIFILRYALSLVRPWYPSFARVQFLDPVTISPIFWDIVDCLAHREVPVIRPQLRDAPVVDRLAGLCASLLPTLYDLCVVGHEMRTDPDRVSRLDNIEAQIRQWTPDYRALETSGCSQIEIALMRTQAVMYKLASLLLIHRLRYPLTSHDDTAASLANEILAERTAFFSRQGSDATLQNVGLPLILALLEVPLSIDDMWESSTRLRVRPICVDRLISFHRYFWEQRLSGFNGSVFELVDRGPTFVVLP